MSAETFNNHMRTHSIHKEKITGKTLLLDRARAILGHDAVPGNRVFVEKKDTGKNSIDAAAEKAENKMNGTSSGGEQQ